MKYIRYEWNKLTGARYAWWTVVLLLALSMLLAYAGTGVSLGDVGRRRALMAEYDAFITYYAQNSEEVTAVMHEQAAFEEEQMRLDTQAHYAGVEYVKEEWVNRYGSDDVGDAALFSMLQSTLAKPADYRVTVGKVIRDAQNNYSELLAMGLAPQSASCRYQQKVEEIYTQRLADVRIGIEYSHGWSEFFANRTTDLLTLCALIFVTSVVFPIERQRGMLSLLRSTKQGRGRVARSKVVLLMLVSVGVTLLFSLTSLSLHAYFLGLSSPANAIQSLPAFTLCQYPLSIGAYFLLQLGVKALTACAFSLALAAVSLAFRHMALMLLGMVALLGSQLLMYFQASGQVLWQFNAVSAMALSTTQRYFGISLFGDIRDAFGVLGVLTLLLLPCGAALSVLLFSRATVHAVQEGALGRAWSLLRPRAGKWLQRLARACRPRRSYALSLCAAEGYKTLIASRLLLPALALLIFCGGALLQEYREYQIPVDDALWREYTTRWEGVLTEQTLNEIRAERTRINQAIAAYQPAKAEFRAGKISADEYSEISRAYFDADMRDEILLLVEEETARLQSLAARGGERAWLLYDTGIERLLFVGDRTLLYVLIILLLIGSYPNEYTALKGHGSGFCAILRTTRRGRGATFAAKLTSSLTLTVVLYLLCAAFEAMLIVRTYHIPDAWGAPMSSLAAYDSVAMQLTLGEGYALILALRGLAYVMLGALTLALSALFGRILSAVGTLLVVTVLPHLLTRFGIAAARAVDFVRLGEVTGLLSALCARDGAPQRIGLIYLATLLLCAIITLLSQRFARRAVV
ncbi:MAG: hypothetical protein IJW40_00590 [Clostridia bacterium]|nr:hypothetical protein [Clostridia bacterium]